MNNIAGCAWNGTFVDNLNGGIPDNLLVKDLAYDPNTNHLYFLASQNEVCGTSCSSLYYYDVSQNYFNYLKNGVGSVFLAFPAEQDGMELSA